MTHDIDQALADAHRRFTEANPASRALGREPAAAP